MKRALLYVPVVLSLVLLGAHFLRYGIWFGVAVAVVLIGLLAIRARWVPALIQLTLVAGSLVWTYTLYQLVQTRMVHGLPYGRLALILGAVSVFTLCSAMVFQSPELKKVYGQSVDEPPGGRR